MKPDKLSELLQNIDETLIARAAKRRRRNNAIIIRTVALCACLALVMTVTLHFAFKNPETFDSPVPPPVQDVLPEQNGKDEGDDMTIPGDDAGNLRDESEGDKQNSTVNGNANTLSAAIYPTAVKYPIEADYGDDWQQYTKAYDVWWEQEKTVRALQTDDLGIREYVSALTKQLLKDNGKNAVISPANLYFALAMLANVTDGNTQKQVLDMLGYDNADKLRANTKNLWQKLYKNDGLTTSILANSLWLSDDYSYRSDIVNVLSNDYYASVYSGDFTDPAYSQSLRNWLNEQTGGLLKEQVKGVEFSDDTVFALASTIYYKAQWCSEFSEQNTKPTTFHGKDGDTTADFMHTEYARSYYWSDNFSATEAALEGRSKMYFILPDEGKSIDSVLTSDAFIDLITETGKVENDYIRINLALPKFDVGYDKNIADDLQALGITDAFDDAKADFSPLMSGVPIELSSVDHAARVKIDEQGCEAAAYTVMVNTGSSRPPEDEVDMIFDRPFIFAITGEDGLPRFIGIVNNI